MYPIDDGIPLPPSRGKESLAKYPWRDLHVDQSFFVACDPRDLDDVMNSLTSCRNYAQRKLGFRFALRRSSKGIRVWRTK